MTKKKQENLTYRECLKALSGWILISTILSLLVKSTSAATIFNSPENIKEQFIGNTLVHGLHSYFPSFSIASYDKKNAFCVLLPPEKICQELIWFLQDFSDPDVATAAKRICGTYVEKIFDILIDTGASFIELVQHNDYYHYSKVIPLNTTTALAFCSNKGADILCSSEFPFPNKTTVDFIMRQADSVHSELMDINLSSIFMKFIVGIIAIGLTIAMMNKDKVKEALQKFSIHRNQDNNASSQTNENATKINFYPTIM